MKKVSENNNMEKRRSEASTNTMFTVIFVSLLIDLLAFTVILPLMPSILDYYGHHSKGGLYGVIQSGVTGFRTLVGAPDTPRWNAVLFGGVIGSLFSCLQFLSSPIMGAASDVYGRRPVMIISMIGVALSYVLWVLSTDFTVFVIARIVGGISKGNVSLSTAVVADVAPPEKRSKGMALIGIAFSFGFLLGPLIGAFFAMKARQEEGGVFFVAPALFALILALADIMFVLIFFKETLPRDKRAESLSSNMKQASQLINPVALFKFSAVQGASPKDLRGMRCLGLVYFLFLFLYSGLEFTLTFLTHLRFNFDSMQQGKMFFVIGIVMIAVQGGYVRRMKPGKEIKMAMMGLVMVIPSFIIIGFSHHISLLYLGLVFFSFASATVVPCLTTLISSYGNVDQKGTVMGIFRSLGALARALGPVVASTGYWCYGATTCYMVGGVLLTLPLVLLAKSKTHIKKD